MKLSIRLTAAIMLALTCLMVVHTYLIVQREIDLFRTDLDRHVYLVGKALAAAVPDIWQVGGLERVRQLIRDANRQEDPLTTRWVFIDSTAPPGFRPALPISELQPLYSGEKIVKHVQLNGRKPSIVAYFPLTLSGRGLSAIEVSEPLDMMYDYINSTLIRNSILLLAVLLIGGSIVWILGIRMVGRPVHAMVQLAESVGQGNFDRHVDLSGRGDELNNLGTGLNSMVDHLRESRRQLNQEIQKQLETLEQLHHAERLTTAGKLASGLAHELGTPLNVVSGRAKMIASHSLNEEQVKESALIISEQADRMASLIRRLLDFVRHGGTLRQTVDTSQLISRVISLLQPMAQQSKVTLVLRSEESGLNVQADPEQIQQVLTNLVVNATNAMPKGGRVEISVATEHTRPPADVGGDEATFVRITVADEGVGIPEENLKRIFMPFFTTMEVGKGTGLGLSIAHGIVGDHGGWIDVKSTVDKGSEFSIHLPLEEK
jgi:two-component system, NtrC family, sensor kinase